MFGRGIAVTAIALLAALAVGSWPTPSSLEADPDRPTLIVEPDAPAPAGAAPEQRPIASGPGSVTIERAADSHFYAEALVNGTPVRFIVDTGATSIVLTREDALRAGIGEGEYSATGLGAAGEVRLMPVTLARLAIGPLATDNVPAMVAEKDLPVSLLGQSYLRRLGTVSISGDRMVLR